TCRRHLLHDAARTLGADHTLVQRMLGVAVDVTQRAVFKVYADAAAARAHIAGRGFDFSAQIARPIRRNSIVLSPVRRREQVILMASYRCASKLGHVPNMVSPIKQAISACDADAPAPSHYQALRARPGPRFRASRCVSRPTDI